MKHIRANVTKLAEENGKTEIEMITQLQAGAAKIGNEEVLDQLCELKSEMIDARLEELHSKTTETDNYIVKWNAVENKWVLYRKYGPREIFMNSCKYSVPLIVAANEMEERLK